jgi:hypothetical protein
MKIAVAVLLVAAIVLLAVVGLTRPLYGWFGIVVLFVFAARALYRTRAEKLRERLLTMPEEVALRAGHYSAKCPRCGRERLYDMENDERIYPENAFEYAGRQIICGRCFFEGTLEPIR